MRKKCRSWHRIDGGTVCGSGNNPKNNQEQPHAPLPRRDRNQLLSPITPSSSFTRDGSPFQKQDRASTPSIINNENIQEKLITVAKKANKARNEGSKWASVSLLCCWSSSSVVRSFNRSIVRLRWSGGRLSEEGSGRSEHEEREFTLF